MDHRIEDRDVFDTADRVLWGNRFKGLCCQLARHENDLSDQYQALTDMRRNDTARTAEHVEALQAFAELREQLASVQEQIAALKTEHDKLLKHLKTRFAELRAERKHDEVAT